MRLIEFEVIDNLTGREPDYEEIIGNEEWAKDLIWCDVEGLAITENRALILADECGRFAYVPEGRFTIKVNEDSLRPKGRWEDKWKGEYDNRLYVCSECGENALLKTEPYMFFRSEIVQALSDFCPNCGADMREGKT